MPWMDITCGKCGHRADIDQFCSTPINGPLPKNIYQCPACFTAFERQFGPATVHPSGWVQPGEVSIVEVQSRL